MVTTASPTGSSVGLRLSIRPDATRVSTISATILLISRTSAESSAISSDWCSVFVVMSGFSFLVVEREPTT